MSELQITKLVVGQLQTNCYIVSDLKTRESLIIDPGDDAQFIMETLTKKELRPHMIIATHGHFDHILATFELEESLRIPFLINKKDEFLIKRMNETARHFLKRIVIEPIPKINGTISKTTKIQVGSASFIVLETPGHTPGSVCLYEKENKILLSGDTLFKTGIGRTDFSYSSADQLSNSLNNLFNLPEVVTVYPGHGDMTTIGNEKKWRI